MEAKISCMKESDYDENYLIEHEKDQPGKGYADGNVQNDVQCGKRLGCRNKGNH